MIRSAASLRRVPVGRVPRLQQYYQRTPTSRRPSRRTSSSFAWRYLRLPRFAPEGLGRFPGPGLLVARCPHRGLRRRRRNLPGSWATRACMPRSPTPAEPVAPDHLGAPMVPSTLVTASASAMRTISWLNHAACKAACVRFADSVTTAHATLGSGWLVNLGRSGLAPAGSLRRFPSLHITSPFTKLRLAQDKPVPYNARTEPLQALDHGTLRRRLSPVRSKIATWSTS